MHSKLGLLELMGDLVWHLQVIEFNAAKPCTKQSGIEKHPDFGDRKRITLTTGLVTLQI